MVKLQHQCQYHVTGREWLGRSFAISQIVGVYQAILQRKVAPVKLKRWLLKNGVIESAEGEGELFSFNSKIYKVAQSQVLGQSAF